MSLVSNTRDSFLFSDTIVNFNFSLITSHQDNVILTRYRSELVSTCCCSSSSRIVGVSSTISNSSRCIHLIISISESSKWSISSLRQSYSISWIYYNINLLSTSLNLEGFVRRNLDSSSSTLVETQIGKCYNFFKLIAITKDINLYRVDFVLTIPATILVTRIFSSSTSCRSSLSTSSCRSRKGERNGHISSTILSHFLAF